MHNGWGPSGHCPAVSQKNHCPAVWKEALCLPRKHCDAGGSHPPTGDLFTTRNTTSHVVFKGYGLYNGFEFETIILIKKNRLLLNLSSRHFLEYELQVCSTLNCNMCSSMCGTLQTHLFTHLSSVTLVMLCCHFSLFGIWILE